MKLKNLLLCFALIQFTAFSSNSQKLESSPNLKNIQLRQTNFNKISMISLNSWAVVNIAYGTIAFYQTTGEAKYFHQMNAIWNVVNLGIGIPGLIGAFKNREDWNFEKTYKTQKSLEAIYLFNSGLDVGYMALGLASRYYGLSQTGNKALRFSGFGSSLLLQGGYLFIHDLASYFMLKTNTKLLDKEWGKLTFTGTGMILQLN